MFSWSRIHLIPEKNRVYLGQKWDDASKLVNTRFAKQLFFVVVHNLVQLLPGL